MIVKLLLGVAAGLEVAFLVVAAVFYGWEWAAFKVGKDYGKLSEAAQKRVRARKAFLTIACAISASLSFLKIIIHFQIRLGVVPVDGC